MINISIKSKLYGLLLVIILMLITSSFLTYRAIIPVQQDWDNYLDNIAKRQSLLMNIKAQFGYGGTIHNFKNYILRGKEKYYKRLKDNFDNLDKSIQTYLSLKGISVEEQQALAAIKTVARNYRSQSDVAHDLIVQGKTPQEVDAVVKVSDKPAFDAFTVLDNVYQQLTEEASGRLSNDIDHTVNFSIWISVFLIILVSISILSIIQIVLHRIAFISAALKKIETDNDLRIRLDTSKNDEVSELSLSINALLERFGDMINQIIKAAVDVGVESSKQSAIVEQTVKGVHQQHKKIELVTQLMANMSETVQNVSINAEQAVGAAELANSGIDRAGEQMRRMIATMDNLNKRIEQAGETISRLEQESQKISSVLEVIHGISEQTNLLALNAAIEAARAGEQGRGFAVVADEVRALAGRTKDSTDEIRNMIERLQTQVASAVKVMDESRNDTGKSSEQTTETGNTLSEVTADIQKMSQAMEQIAQTSSEQFTVSMKMNEHIVAIQDEALNTAKFADETLTATGHIGQKTELLCVKAGQFKISIQGQLEQAKAAHLAWRSKLMSYLSGELSLDSKELSSHRDCILGQWYYSEGLKNFSYIPEMKELEAPHEEIHQVIHHVVDYKQAGDNDKALKEFEKITPLSARIVEIIDRIIAKL